MLGYNVKSKRTINTSVATQFFWQKLLTNDSKWFYSWISKLEKNFKTAIWINQNFEKAYGFQFKKLWFLIHMTLKKCRDEEKIANKSSYLSVRGYASDSG